MKKKNSLGWRSRYFASYWRRTFRRR